MSSNSNKNKKRKIKDLTIEDLLSEQLFYKAHKERQKK